MPRVRALVPLEDEEGPIAVDEVFEASDEQAAALRASGKVSLIADEEASIKAGQQGHYSDVMGREEVAEPKEDAADPIPPAHKKGKK